MGVEHDMIRIGRIVAADQGLDVECRGMMAYATPGKVVIPSLANLDHLGPDAERMMHGYLDHECAHASDSDFELFKKAAEDHGDSLKNMFNAVEDGYVEGRQGLRFRGSQHNLRQKNEWFWNRKDDEGKTVPDRIADPAVDPWRKFTVAVTMCARPWGSREIEDFKALDEGTYERLKLVAPLIDEVAPLFVQPKASAKCYSIALRIWQMFDQDSPPPKGGEKAPEDLQLPLGAWDENAKQVLKLLKDPESAINQALQAVLAGADMGTSCDYDGLVRPPKDSDGNDVPLARGTYPYINFSDEFDHVVDFTGDIGVSDKYETLIDETREAADALVTAFEAALRSRMEAAPSYGHDEGFIDTQALGEFAVGARPVTTIYQQFQGEVDADDVAVSVVVDCSGSMGSYDRKGSKARLAAQTAAALHRACASCDLAHEIVGFTTTYGAHAWAEPEDYDPWVVKSEMFEKARLQLIEAAEQGQEVSKFARLLQGDAADLYDKDKAPLCFPAHAIFKSFGAPDARGISHIDGLSGNLDGEAVMWAARRLAERPEKRRVMFVLSDGQPSAANYHADQCGFLKESVGRIIHAGIECYGIGIKSTAVSSYYPIHWVAHSLDDLTEIAMGALMEVLGLNRQEHTCVSL